MGPVLGGKHGAVRLAVVLIGVAWVVLLAPGLACTGADDGSEPWGTGGSATGGSGAGATDGGTHDAWTPPADPFAPRCFYTDLVSGPADGGQDDQGAFVTIYGKGFGVDQGSSTVTAGGGEVAGYPIWTDTRLTVQLGAAAQSGDLVVHVPGHEPSNGLPFAIRPGRIFFVGPGGAASNDGSYDHPWLELAAAKRRLEAGDILYGMDGLDATSTDGPNTALCISQFYGCETAAGTASSPLALLAYPGALVTVGCQQGGCPSNGVRIYAPYWTVAGLVIVGSSDTYAAAVSLEKAGDEPPSHGQRLVGNDITGGYYGVTISTAMDCQVLGNHVHDTPHSAIYHGGWGQSANVEIAWNVVHDLGEEAFGIKAYGHTPEDHLTDLWIHHNMVYNSQAPGILVGGSDGAVPWVYDAAIENNVVWNVQGQWSSGIRIGNSGVDETELAVVIAHNTVVAATHSIAIDACQSSQVQNNLFVQSGGSYIHGDLGPGTHVFDHNGYFGGDAVPPVDTAPINGDDPLLVDPVAGDFHLQPGSPAVDSGVDTGIIVDFDGLLRPQGAGFDVGAYELKLPE